MDEKEYKEELKNAGVDVDELNQEPTTEEPSEPEQEVENDEKQEEDEGTPEPSQKKRSIYDEYKTKKNELKTEREAREKAENERNELQQKLEAIQQAETTQEKEDAIGDLDKFAEEIGADPEAIKKLHSRLVSDAVRSVSKELDELRNFKNEASSMFSERKFEQAYEQAQDDLRDIFPNASDQDMKAIKSELKKLGATGENIAFTAFQNRNELGMLITPKKKGIESRSRQDNVDIEPTFDPNADLSTMSQKELAEWESQYRKLGKQSGLAKDSQGRQIFI